MTEQIDTLVADPARLSYWQSDPAFDYNAELSVSPPARRGNVLLDWLYDILSKLLELIFGRQIDVNYTRAILIVLIFLFIVLLIWMMYKKRDRWLPYFRASSVPHEVSEDTIYGVDFDADIRMAVSQGDYREAGRLIYLQTLRNLSDRELIFWELYKTPTQYLYELKKEDLRTSFRSLTNHFLQIRYGNFQATPYTFEQMSALRDSILKKGGQS